MDANYMNDEMSTSQTSTTSSNNSLNGTTTNGAGKKTSVVTPDPTGYVAKARVTRPTPPPPSYNPMQFVQIKPCNLYQTAQEQLKKAEEVKKIKEIKKEEPEDWQNNLDNWKSSRRKRVEHIIDRVVEVKKLELEEHDRTRRKSKTFSEMIEERGERGARGGLTKLASLTVYNEDEVNDLSDLGIGTSSASGKSSLSEECDNNSVMSDNAAELDKAITDNNHKPNHSTIREYISSPGYDTSSSTAPASSPDPCEYTYEGAIQDYKQRVSRAASSGIIGNAPNYKLNMNNKTTSAAFIAKESTPDRTNGVADGYPTRRGSKIEDRLIGFEVTSPSDTQDVVEKQKVDVPKIDISKRKEMFENQNQNNTNIEPKASTGAPRVTLRDRFKPEANNETNGEVLQSTIKREVKRLSGDITSIKDRKQSLEQQNFTNGVTKSINSKLVDIPVPPLKDRLHSLQNAVTKEEVKKPPVVLVDQRQLEIMKNEEEVAQQRLKQEMEVTQPKVVTHAAEDEVDRSNDSGIHNSDADINDVEEHIISEKLQKEQEQQLNAAIAALALEEKQLEEAANAVNQIEAEFAELTDSAAAIPALDAAAATNEQPCDMEFSINEALELALEAIDQETKSVTNDFADIKSHALELVEKIVTIKETTNTTDEEKQLKQFRNDKEEKPPAMNEIEQFVDEVEVKISKEPIYENVSATSTLNVDAVTNIIPNMNNNESNIMNSNNININNNNNNNNDNKINNKNNNTIINQNQNNNQNNRKNSLTNNQNNQTTKTTSSAFIAVNTTKNATTIATATTVKNEVNQTILTTSTAQLTPPTKPKPLELPNLIEQTSLTTDSKYQQMPQQQTNVNAIDLTEPYYQVPKSSEPYYDAPKHLRPVPVYENIEIFYTTGNENSTLNVINTITTTANPLGLTNTMGLPMEPPKEKPPPPPIESPPLFDDAESFENNTDTWSSSDNTYETISSRHQISKQHNGLNGDLPTPPIKRMNSTKRIKKELRNKRSSFLGIESSNLDDDESYLELTVAPPPDMAQLLQEERRLEKQLYLKAGLCDSSDTGESRDSGVSENHSRQSSEHYTNSSEDNDHIESPPPPASLVAHVLTPNEIIYQNETSLLTTVKGNSAESWTESATVAAAATKSLTEATATANAKMLSIEEKIREQEEVLRVERELLQLEQEELKRQRENLMLRENMARRELQHGAKMLMSANRHSLQDLNGVGLSVPDGPVMYTQQHMITQQQPMRLLTTAQPQQQIYANIPNVQQQQPPHHSYYQVDSDYRKSMSDINEFSKRLMLPLPPPTPPTKPQRTLLVGATTHANGVEGSSANHRHSLNAQSHGGSLVKIAAPQAAPRGHIYSNYHHHQSVQNLSNLPTAATTAISSSMNGHVQHSNMSRNTLHALSATPKPKYTDGWVQVQNRKTYDNNFANDPAWLSAYQQKRKSMPEANYQAYNNHWLVQEAEQRRIAEQQRLTKSSGNQQNGGNKILNSINSNNVSPTKSTSNGKPLPDSIIQTLTERVQSKGIGERKRFDNYNNNNSNIEKSPLHAAASYYHHHHHLTQSQHRHYGNDLNATQNNINNNATSQTTTSNINNAPITTPSTTSLIPSPDKVLSVSGKKKCSHCGDELGRGAAMIIESLLLFYHINCFKCCVCHVQLGDGLNGTDVRVRNHKLHCQNCYSSDDGIKFSCV